MKLRALTSPKRVTRVTWETRHTTRGPKTRLIAVPTATPSKGKRRSVPSTPTNVNQSTSHPSSPLLPDLDIAEDAFDVLPRHRNSTKVRANSVQEAHPLIPRQTQNDYIREWQDHKQDYLRCLMEMEAPPNPRHCAICGGDGIYRCPECFGCPLYCTRCCREQHHRNPFHRIEQWTGAFFETSSIHIVR